jgi:hypothetical protein
MVAFYSHMTVRVVQLLSGGIMIRQIAAKRCAECPGRIVNIEDCERSGGATIANAAENRALQQKDFDE